MSTFDPLASAAFRASLFAFGTEARWTPAQGGPTRSATVLFQSPSGAMDLDRWKYMPLEPQAEFYSTMLPGLKASVDAGNVERLMLGSSVYFVHAVEAVHDGLTMRAKLVFDPESSETPVQPVQPVPDTGSLSWFRFVQEQPATIWIIDHPLNRGVSIFVTDLVGDIEYIPYIEIDPSANYRVKLYFDEPTSGIATLT